MSPAPSFPFPRAAARGLATALALTLGLALGAPAAWACAPNLAQADAVLEAHRVDRALPGAALAVFDAGGTSFHERWFGSYHANTYVPIASASKVVSAAVIMSLVDDGTMALDDTVADYLPAYAGTPNGAITLRQAFSQTSGLWNDEWPCVADAGAVLADCVADILDHAPRVSAPGATFFYGSNSMHVAGRMAEVAYCARFPANCAGLGSGAVWRRIFDERLRAPLGLGMFFNSATNPRIDGGVISRLSDYRTLWRMIMNGGTVDGVRVLSPEAVQEITRDQTRGAALYYSAAQPWARYGLGMWRLAPDSAGAAHVLNDPGRFGFHPFWDLDAGVAGIVMINDAAGAGTGGGRHVANQVEQVVHDRFLAWRRARGDDDRDADGICDAADACPEVPDPARADADADGAGDACDVAPADARAWAAPGETGTLVFYPRGACLSVSYVPQTGAIVCVPTENLLDWYQPARPGAVVTDLRYDVVRSADPADFVLSAACEASAVERNGPFNNDHAWADPAPGGLFAYLARARGPAAAGPAEGAVGPAGFDSAGLEIPARACP